MEMKRGLGIRRGEFRVQKDVLDVLDVILKKIQEVFVKYNDGFNYLQGDLNMV